MIAPRVTNPEAIGDPAEDPVVVIDDPIVAAAGHAWGQSATERIRELEEAIRRDHDEHHDGPSMHCEHESCRVAGI